MSEGKQFGNHLRLFRDAASAGVAFEDLEVAWR